MKVKQNDWAYSRHFQGVEESELFHKDPQTHFSHSLPKRDAEVRISKNVF